MERSVTGFIVVATNGRFLSRSLRWVRHRVRDESGKDVHGTRRAWVHPLEIVRNGGKWKDEAFAVMPACFDPELGFTAIAGEAQGYSKFVASKPVAQGERDPNTPYWY